MRPSALLPPSVGSSEFGAETIPMVRALPLLPPVPAPEEHAEMRPISAAVAVAAASMGLGLWVMLFLSVRNASIRGRGLACYRCRGAARQGRERPLSAG